jgi:hypothetical protein
MRATRRVMQDSDHAAIDLVPCPVAGPIPRTIPNNDSTNDKKHCSCHNHRTERQ